MQFSLTAQSESPKSARMAVSAFFFVQGLSFASWASRIPDIKTRLGLSEGELGSVLFALPVGLMISLPVSGWLVSKYGSRKMVVLGALLYAFTLIFIGLSATVTQLVASLFVFGIWSNLTNIAVNTQAVGVENMYGRSVMASFHGLWSLAGFLGAMIGAYFITQQVSPYTHFSLIVLLACIIVFLFYKNTVQVEQSTQENQPIFVKPDRELLLLGLIGFCAMVCEGAMFDWSGVYFQKAVNVPVAKASIGYVAFMATMTGGRFTADWLVNKVGKKKMLQASGLIIGVGLLISVLFPYLVPATLGFLLVGFGVSFTVPLVYSSAGKSKTMSPGMALAAVSSISFLGFLIGPPLIGHLAEIANIRWAFAVVAVLGSCTTLLVLRAKLIK